MRVGGLVLALVLSLYVGACRHAQIASFSGSARNFATASLAAAAKKPDFETEIRPIFQTKCQPCHFPGGKVYDRMPFDKAETINRLGTKLFTRIKDEKEQGLIREFLAQP
jgi:cytochrome c5